MQPFEIHQSVSEEHEMKFLLIKNIRIFIIPKKGISKFPFTHALLSKRSRFRNQRSIPESTNRKSLTKPSRSSFPPSPLNVFCAQRKQGSTNERTLDESRSSRFDRGKEEKVKSGRGSSAFRLCKFAFDLVSKIRATFPSAPSQYS